jgi:hypothetical protein
MVERDEDLLPRSMKPQFARAPVRRGRAWASSRPLSFVGAAMLLVLGVAVVGLLLDERVTTSHFNVSTPTPRRSAPSARSS